MRDQRLPAAKFEVYPNSWTTWQYRMKPVLAGNARGIKMHC